MLHVWRCSVAASWYIEKWINDLTSSMYYDMLHFFDRTEIVFNFLNTACADSSSSAARFSSFRSCCLHVSCTEYCLTSSFLWLQKSASWSVTEEMPPIKKKKRAKTRNGQEQGMFMHYQRQLFWNVRSWYDIIYQTVHVSYVMFTKSLFLHLLRRGYWVFWVRETKWNSRSCSASVEDKIG